MVSNHFEGSHGDPTISAIRRSEILRSLIPVATRLVNAQLDAFSARLANALLAQSEASKDPKEANLTFNVGNQLKNNQYAFYHLASACFEKTLQQEVSAFENTEKLTLVTSSLELSLVSYEEMDNKVSLSNASRAFEADNDGALTALNRRLSSLLGRSTISLAQNPFRPEVFLNVINNAWAEFDPDGESQPMILPLLRPELFIELPPILHALNDALIARGIMPELVESYRIKKSNGNLNESGDSTADASVLSAKLKQLFAPQAATAGGGFGPAPTDFVPAATGFGQAPSQGFPQLHAEHMFQTAATSSQLFNFLANLQQGSGGHAMSAGAHAMPNTMRLSQIKEQMPRGAMSRGDETTLDLLSKVFDRVYQDHNIPGEIKELIGVLQVPVLKAALIDKEFFFQAAHPARRLIEVLAKSSVAWDQGKGQDDPLYQTMKRNVDRVQQEFKQEITLFSDVVSDLETFITDEETAAAAALAAPITVALKQEKIRVATKSAETEVAVRVATGEVATFVEAFLEKKWVPILTLAYSVKEEKPQVLQNAVRTMDELIWSVQPKITAAERKELISKLPSLLAALNKWITLVKWEDADRLKFFADLAECHASIVRAPLELSPQRQVEIAVQAAQIAAEKRMAKRANVQPEPVADESTQFVEKLERGIWINFTQKDGSEKKVKLAWVSPLRSLYIFTTSQKEEAFSLSADDLSLAFREARAQVVVLDRFVDRALTQALETVGVNDEVMVAPMSA